MSTDSATLLALADMCEEANRDDRKLENEIALAIFGPPEPNTFRWLPCLSVLNAATKLARRALPGWRIRIDIEPNDFSVATVTRLPIQPGIIPEHEHGEASDPAAALVSAVLRALAASTSTAEADHG